jgi:hypothetical protein
VVDIVLKEKWAAEHPHDRFLDELVDRTKITTLELFLVEAELPSVFSVIRVGKIAYACFRVQTEVIWSHSPTTRLSGVGYGHV